METRLEESLLNIMGSALHLSKTIMNLVSNAAEAMPEGGKILLKTENRTLDGPIKGYEVIAKGEYVILSIADSGTGIPPENLARIFEPFYTKKIMGRSGTGLGMAVVWGTVKDNHGYIDIQSAEGKGTTFELYFLSSRRAATQKVPPKSIDRFKAKGESILIVDDTEEQRGIASGILKKLGYRVSSVSSGEAAIQYLSNRPVDLIVLDMLMEPGMDGLETYRRVVEHRPGQKAVITSGFPDTDRVDATRKLGAGHYIKKPYTLETIGMAVREELDR